LKTLGPIGPVAVGERVKKFMLIKCKKYTKGYVMLVRKYAHFFQTGPRKKEKKLVLTT
jgi:hypothetical protein